MEEMAIEAFKTNLAKRIKEIRKSKKITQGALALKMGFKDKQVINNYEKNGANPTAYNLVLLAKALEVSLDELVDFSSVRAGMNDHGS